MPTNYKIALCTKYQHGNCNNKNCKFAHGREELQKFNPKYKTKMCDNIEKKIECPHANCPYAHSRRELKSLPAI